METCDALVVGGGPAGAACAWKLRRAGLDVLVLERATFPRDKPCAGWITPQILDELAIDPDEYRRGRTFQPIGGFRIGLIGAARDVVVNYGRPVSFSVRRCEFDEYLLTRAAARVRFGEPLRSLVRDGAAWMVNGEIRAPVVVGAGGHFCPVAAALNGPLPHDPHVPLVVAQEAEFRIDSEDRLDVAPDVPEFYFADDFGGYGWCCRKQEFVNIGFGHVAGLRTRSGNEQAPRGLPAGTREFVSFLERKNKVRERPGWPWRGHAYLLRDRFSRHITADGVVLVGDAAGLAYPQSGEGIRPAIESGLMAAETLLEAAGDFSEHSLSSYEARLRARFGTGSVGVGSLVPAAVVSRVGRALMTLPWFVRTVVLDRWFLHADEPALSA